MWHAARTGALAERFRSEEGEAERDGRTESAGGPLSDFVDERWKQGTVMHTSFSTEFLSRCHSTMVKPLEKSIKFWDGHGPLRLVEL